jgi:hypothetical protein
MRRRNRITSFLLFALAATIATSAATLYSRGRSTRNGSAQSPNARRSRDRDGEDFETQFPTADLETPEPADPDKRVRRQKKNKRYDNLNVVSQRPSQSIDETVVDNHWQESVAALPVSQSNVIILCEALGASTHLSNDKKGVYTEFSVRVSEVIKTDDPALTPGGVLDVDRPGGFVRYPDGHKVLYRTFGLNMLRPNRRYLLFLNNTDESLNYRVLTAYEITPGGVSPLDVGPQFDTYKGMDEIHFLQAVREAVAQNP